MTLLLNQISDLASDGLCPFGDRGEFRVVSLTKELEDILILHPEAEGKLALRELSFLQRPIKSKFWHPLNVREPILRGKPINEVEGLGPEY